MKKRQSIFCVALLSMILVGNVFASPTVGTSVLGLLDSAVSAVVSLLSEACPVRQCQDCRPSEVVDENGHCRPKEN